MFGRGLIRRFSSSVHKKRLTALSHEDLQGKNVFVRLDFNVPRDKLTKEITDDTRIRKALPTIEYLRSNGARTILCSHAGRPQGKTVKSLEATGMAPISARLQELLSHPVGQAEDCVGPDVQSRVASLKDGDILMLENVRFHSEESTNDPDFAQQLAQSSSAQVYVNDAFGCCHRDHGSTVGITNFVEGPCVAGHLLDRELTVLQGALDDPKRPFIAIVGGSKVSSKLPMLESLLDRADKIVLGGAMILYPSHSSSMI
jgi:phosphoglycerate kinase